MLAQSGQAFDVGYHVGFEFMVLFLQGKIHYYMREKYYGHAQNEALDGLRKYGNDPLLKFYVGATKVLEGELWDSHNWNMRLCEFTHFYECVTSQFLGNG